MKEEILEKFREDENFILETEVASASLEPIWGIAGWLKETLVIFITNEGLKHVEKLVLKLMNTLKGLEIAITIKFATGRSFEFNTAAKDLEKDVKARIEEEKRDAG